MSFFGKKKHEDSENEQSSTEVKKETKTHPFKDSQKYIRKGSTFLMTKESINTKSNVGFFNMSIPIMKLPESWSEDYVSRSYSSDFSSYDLCGYDNVWVSAASHYFSRDTSDADELPCKVIVNVDKRPDGKLDIAKYLDRDSEYEETLLKVYDTLTKKALSIETAGLKRMQESIEKSKGVTPEEAAEEARKEYKWDRFLLLQNCLQYEGFQFTYEELGIFDIPRSEDTKSGTVENPDVRMCFVTHMEDVQNLIFPDFSEYKPNSLAEVNCILNKYHSGINDTKVLAAVSKKLDSLLNEREIEMEQLKKAINC